MRRRQTLVLFVVTIVLACAGQPKRSGELLTTDLRVYNEALRWRRYDDAAARLPVAQREAFLDERQELDEDLRIDEYEVERIKLDREEKTAVVLVKYVWHLDSTGIVHETLLEQDWEFQERGWWLVAERRKRGQPLPHVAEPARDDRGLPE
jgi:hypothetical protein